MDDLDDFSDDGFDDLTAHALHELEQNAIQLTQGHALAARPSKPQPSQQPPSQRHPSQQQRLSDYGWEQEDDDLDTTEVTNGVAARSVARPAERVQHLPRRAAAPPPPNPRWNPAVDPASRPRHVLPPPPPPSQREHARPLLPPGRFGPSQAQQPPSGDVAAALRQRLLSLEDELRAARGEASIIRANSIKAQQDHDAQIARLKKANAEQLACQERLVEAAVAAERSAATELQFLQRDMREASNFQQARRRGAPAGDPATPKKAVKTWAMADGFDQVDVAPSPTKGQARAKGSSSVAANVGERTPTKGKRKRPVVDAPLETHTDGDVDAADGPASQLAPSAPAPAAPAPTAPFEVIRVRRARGETALTCKAVSTARPRPRAP